MEAELRHCEVIQLALCLHRARLATHRNRDIRIVFAVELVGPQRLQAIDRLVNARLHLGPAVILLRQARQSDAGDAAGAEGVIADLAHLALQREHVGIEPQIEYRGNVPFLRGGVFLGFLQYGLEAAEQLEANGQSRNIAIWPSELLLHEWWRLAEAILAFGGLPAKGRRPARRSGARALGWGRVGPVYICSSTKMRASSPLSRLVAEQEAKSCAR
jgi:hypothetical protein